jgi:hypothetical protein
MALYASSPSRRAGVLEMDVKKFDLIKKKLSDPVSVLGVGYFSPRGPRL